MEEDEEDEIPLDMEDIEAVSKRARQDEDLNTEHLQVQLSITSFSTLCCQIFFSVLY
jgi:hypothetical protein